MALFIDGNQGETTVVDTDIFTEYTFQADLAAGNHTLGVSFLNDAYNPGVEDRNLYLDRIEIYPFDITAVTTATLSWQAPSTNMDGSELTDLAGYILYVGPSSGIYIRTIDVGSLLTYTLTDLAPGSHYFCVSAVDLSGNESICSNEVYQTGY
jgi:hypothetical protein